MLEQSNISFIVGIPGFEPGTPCSQSRCANRTALHPAIIFKCKGTTYFEICNTFRKKYFCPCWNHSKKRGKASASKQQNNWWVTKIWMSPVRAILLHSPGRKPWVNHWITFMSPKGAAQLKRDRPTISKRTSFYLFFWEALQNAVIARHWDWRRREFTLIND